MIVHKYGGPSRNEFDHHSGYAFCGYHYRAPVTKLDEDVTCTKCLKLMAAAVEEALEEELQIGDLHAYGKRLDETAQLLGIARIQGESDSSLRSRALEYVQGLSW